MPPHDADFPAMAVTHEIQHEIGGRKPTTAIRPLRRSRIQGYFELFNPQTEPETSIFPSQKRLKSFDDGN